MQRKTKKWSLLEKINEYVLNHPLAGISKSEFIEAVSTVFHLRNTYPDKFDDEIFELTKDLKSHLSDSIIIIAINTVKKVLFKPEFLTEEIRKEIEIWDRAED